MGYTYSPIQMNENQHIAAENGFEYGYMTMVEAQVTNSSVAESMWGIARNSERPDKHQPVPCMGHGTGFLFLIPVFGCVQASSR